MLRRVMVVLVSALLVLSLFGANVALGVDRGPMDPDRVSTAAAEAGVYEEAQSFGIEMVEEEIPEEPWLEWLAIAPEEALEEIVTPAYMQSQTEQNIENVFTFLDGGDELRIYVDLAPLKENAIEYVEHEDQLLDRDRVAADDGIALPTEQTYEDDREALRDEVLTVAGITPEDGFGDERLANLYRDEDTFEGVKAEYRGQIRDELREEWEIHADKGYGHDQLAGMLHDPETYGAEQETFREERIEAIMEETGASREEAEEEYADREDEFAAEAGQAYADQLIPQDAPTEVATPMEELGMLMGKALATDLDHEAFLEEYDRLSGDVDAGLESYTAENIGAYEDDIRTYLDEDVDTGELPSEVQPHVDELLALITEAVVTDMAHDVFVSEYDEIAADIEAAALELVNENIDEYIDDFENDLIEVAGFEDLPGPVDENADRFTALMLEMVATDMEYEAFESGFAALEEDLAIAMIEDSFAEEGEDGIPTTIDMSADLEEDADELSDVQTAYGMLSYVWIGLLGVATLLLGVTYLIAGRWDTVALAAGSAAAVVGGATYGGLTLAENTVRDVLLEEDDVPAAVVEVGLDFFVAVFRPLELQSIIFLGGGVMLFASGIVLRSGLADDLIPTEMIGNVESEENPSDREMVDEEIGAGEDGEDGESEEEGEPMKVK